MHTRTHTYTHTRTHVCTYTHTHTHIHTPRATDNPEFTNDDDRNYTVVEGKNTDAVECVARSFPPSIVTWRLSKTLDGLDNPDSRISEDPGHRYFNDIGSFMPGFELSIDGQIVIMNASSVDERFYRCTVTNEASGEIIIRNRILRVRGESVCVCVCVCVCLLPSGKQGN